MGGVKSANYERFCEMACRAFNIVRRNARVFIALFAMMVSTGIPELQSLEDINYLRTALVLDLSDAEAEERFRGLIKESLGTTSTNFNNFVHVLAKPG